MLEKIEVTSDPAAVAGVAIGAPGLDGRAVLPAGYHRRVSQSSLPARIEASS